ncbi:MAG: ABC transporter substrate-binding protein [Planctomycetota bacterium]|jgi:tungstate transport system substrate-binding protein
MLGIIAVVASAALLCVSGCGREEAARPAVKIRLATTTSTENSGLLEAVLPAFRRRTGIEVLVMPMGTGKALRTARDGNCDAVLVHAPEAEEQFVREGWGVGRRQVMYNDFIVLGPADDPAGVKGAASAAEAMERIAGAAAPFVSRGDRSGTHRKEQSLWRSAGLTPAGAWYRSVGRGMGETLTIADQMNAYVLTDRGTYVRFRGRLRLAIAFEGDGRLGNPYGVIAVNPARHGHVRHGEAMRFIEFLTSDEGRKLIGGYRLDGEVLFHPWPVATVAADGA